MSCRCGHGPWHRYGHAYPPYPTAAYPSPAYPPPAYPPSPPRRGRRTRIEDLEGYLSDLEGELARVREELAEYRRDGAETV